MLFDGPVFTVFTSFDSTSKLDIRGTLNYIDFLISHDVKIFYVMPYNSRYLQLNEQEILKLNSAVTKHVKENSDGKIIVSGPVQTSTEQTLLFCENALKSGADYFASAFGEKYFSDDQIVEHYDNLQTNFEKIIVHEQPLISGYDSKQMNWPLSLVEEVAKLNRVVAFKEDTKSYEYGVTILEKKLPAEFIFAGRKSLFIPLIKHGLTSYLNGISIVNPKIGFLFWDMVKKQKFNDLKKFVSDVDDPFWDGPVKKYGWHRVNKASLEYFGLMSRVDRLPMKHLSNDEYADVVSFWNSHIKVINEWL